MLTKELNTRCIEHGIIVRPSSGAVVGFYNENERLLSWMSRVVGDDWIGMTPNPLVSGYLRGSKRRVARWCVERATNG